MCFLGDFLAVFTFVSSLVASKSNYFVSHPKKKTKKNLLGEVDENGNLHPFWLKKKKQVECVGRVWGIIKKMGWELKKQIHFSFFLNRNILNI